MIEEANKAREDIWTPLSEIYGSFYNAYMSLGTMTLESTSDSTPSIMEVDVNVRRIVDVKIPTLQVKTEKGKQRLLAYGFVETKCVDKAARLNQEHAPWICKATRIKMQYLAFAKELQAYQKLINALEYVIIPQYEHAIYFIKATLKSTSEKSLSDSRRLKQY